MKIKILFWAMFVVCCLMALYFSVRCTQVFLGHSGIIDVQKILPYSFADRPYVNSISKIVSMPIGVPSYRVKLDDVLQRILSIPEIEAASVVRSGRGDLRIKIRIKTAVATWTDGINYYPLSADGTLINRPDDKKNPDMLIFQGPIPANIMDIINIMKTAPEIMAETDHMEWVEDRRWNIHTLRKMIIKLPEIDVANAVSELVQMNKKNNILHRAAKVLDMRDAARNLVVL